MKLYYDLHMHSCLSPCGSEDMTPANLAAMCALAGLDVVALTDHNTCGNCASFCRAAEERGLLALAGRFGEYVYARLSPGENDPAVFGPQVYMDQGDGILGEEPRMLAGTTLIPLAEVPGLAEAYGGFAWPAHIDRPSFSLLGVLGVWDPELRFPLAELSHSCPPEFIRRRDLAGLRFITSSDAHYLDQVYTAEHVMELPERSPEAVLNWLRNGK